MKADDAMKNEYLWDGQGEPDADIARLERVLRPLRYQRRPLEMPAAVAGQMPILREARMSWRGAGLLLALAAALLFIVRPVWRAGTSPSSSAWTVEMEPAATRPETTRASRVARSVRSNEWIVVNGTSRARLSADGVGVIELEPGSRVRLLTSTAEEHRLQISVGVLHATIWAPPGQVSVETPSTTATDLGCAYTLEVDEEGASLLRVTAGWVGLAGDGRDAFVPAGAVCRTTPGGTMGTPRREDAARAFVRALDVLDGTQPVVGDTKPQRGHAIDDAHALDLVLQGARPEDAFSLWHLLTRLDQASASRVYERLAVLATPPSGVTRERVLARDRASLDAWWNSLGIGDATWYRTFRAR